MGRLTQEAEAGGATVDYIIEGAVAGAIASSAVAATTGVGGISVTAAGVSTVVAGGNTISPTLQDLFTKTSSHIFSDDHVRNSLMNLGKDKIDIFNKIINIAGKSVRQWKDGSNEIRTVINGIETTVRFYVKEGKIINIDAFVGYSERVIGNLIKQLTITADVRHTLLYLISDETLERWYKIWTLLS